MILRVTDYKKLYTTQANIPSVYVGENKFDEIKIILPDKINGIDSAALDCKAHLVNIEGDYFIIPFTVSEHTSGLGKYEGSFAVDSSYTEKSQWFNIYIEFNADGGIIGKTNCVELFVNPLPDETNQLISRDELEQEIEKLKGENETYQGIIEKAEKLLEENTAAMNRIDGFKDGRDGRDGEDGKSAYEIAVDKGFVGNEEKWLESLKGAKGDKGDTGLPGADGVSGIGITKSKINDSGELVLTYTNGESDNLGKVVGADGANGTNGKDGSDYVLTEQDKRDIAQMAVELIPTTEGVLYGNQSN